MMAMGGCSSIFILVLFSVVNILRNGNGLNEEGSALLSFKASMSEDPDGSLAKWNSSDQTPCSWNGITCNKGGNVVSLSLVRSRLKGPLPVTWLSSLPSLRRINLRSNRLLGNIPPALFRSPSSLHTLVLSMNSLSGPLPPELATLKTLRVLDLSHNSLRGSIPVSLTQCCCCSSSSSSRLRTLMLSHNNFTGPLPFGLANTFTSLERIDLSYNGFSGPIPEDIGNLSALDSTADFSHNLFSGSVPPSLGSLPEKVYLDLSYNNLTGTIPQNGSLLNRGPTAFAGNPSLCGLPLKNACMVPSGSKGSSNVSDVTSSRRLSRSVLIAIIVCDLVGIGVVAMVFYYLYRRAVSSKEKVKKRSLRKGLMLKEFFCFRKDEADSSSVNMGQTNLIPLDRQVNFSLNELLQSTALVLGKSQFGIVYKVMMDDRSTLAVRRLGEGGSQRFKEFQREVEAIGRVRHSNIVSLRAYYWSIEEKLLIYDYIPGGNLSTAIHGRDGDSTFSPLLWRSRLKIMKGVAKGLAFLHECSPKKYVHGNLKPRNVLLGLNMMPYISDFGLGRLAYIAEGSTPERAQNQFCDAAVSPVTSSRFCYHAPEALRSPKPSQKWDIYSFGVILLELISGQSPLLLLDTQEMDLVQWFQFCISKRKPLFDVLDPYLAQEPEIEDEIITVLKIALACVESNPERRPSMKLVEETLERSITRS